MSDSGACGKSHSCVARCAVQDPPFGEVSGCFARILGESWDSGLGLGLDALSILGVVKKDLHFSDREPDLRSGLIIGDSGAV